MKGLITYQQLSELTLNDALIAIRNVSPLKYCDIKLSDLLLSGSVENLLLSDYTTREYYGMGIYIFFDTDVPVYVGKADNFLHRLSSHRTIDVRPNWGWNALLKKVCIKRLGISDDKQENLMKALSLVENFCVTRVLLNIDAAREKLSRFERIIMKGIKHQSDTLLNTGIGKVNDVFIRTSLSELMW